MNTQDGPLIDLQMQQFEAEIAKLPYEILKSEGGKILSVRYNVSDIAMRGRIKKNIKKNGTFVLTDSIKAGKFTYNK